MSLFSVNKQQRAKQFLLRYANRYSLKSCDEIEELRSETREPICMPVCIVPIVDGQPEVETAFHGLMRDIASRSMGVLIHEPIASSSLLVGVPDETGPSFVLMRMRACSRLAEGFYVLGLQAEEIVEPRDFPALQELNNGCGGADC